MRTEAELQRAGELLAWYVSTGVLDRMAKNDPETGNALMGTIATIEWMRGDENNPVAGTLRDIERSMNAHKRN